MARIGKIARMSREIRNQINARLEAGHPGKVIVRWLNSLPEVRDFLAAAFPGQPITEQNLSDWRLGGYEEWLARREIFAEAHELAADLREVDTHASGAFLSDHLAAAVELRYTAILAVQGPALDEPALSQLRALLPLCQVAVKLRRSDQDAARLRMESQRWDLARLKMCAQHEEERKRKQRAALAAPIRALLEYDDLRARMGGAQPGDFLLEVLRRIETCDDPADFIEEYNRLFTDKKDSDPCPRKEAKIRSAQYAEPGRNVKVPQRRCPGFLPIEPQPGPDAPANSEATAPQSTPPSSQSSDPSSAAVAKEEASAKEAPLAKDESPAKDETRQASPRPCQAANPPSMTEPTEDCNPQSAIRNPKAPIVSNRA